MILLALLAVGFGARGQAPQPEESVTDEVIVHFFWREGCAHCDAQKPVLADLAARHEQVVIDDHDVARDPDALALLFSLGEALEFEPRGVPVTVIGHRSWVGFTPAMVPELEAAVQACLQVPCPDPRLVPPEAIPPPPQRIELPLLGTLDLGGRSLWVSTALIAFVDGFNPCSLWVLSILLALVLNVGSRQRTLLIGGTFLLVTALVYGVFVAGLFHVFALLRWLEGVRVLVALLALGFALVNIKDYFWLGRGLSFTISDRQKPRIYKRIRALASRDGSPWALVGATVLLALGVALVELPCTAGFPVLWTNLLAAHGVSGAEFTALLALYIAIYLFDEALVFGTAVFTLRMSRLQERHGRVLKLVGGGVMLALAVVLLVDPDRMNDLTGSLTVFGLAFAGIALVLVVHRVLLPRLGIHFGSEDLDP